MSKDVARDLARVGDLLGAAGEGWHVLDVAGRTVDGQLRPWWARAAKLRRELPLFEKEAWDGELQINAVPLTTIGRHLDREPTSLLWTQTDDGNAANRLRNFRPAPAVVLRQGETVRYTAFWLLEDLLPWSETERYCKRIAHKISAPKKYASSSFTFWLPGTFMRSGRTRPVPIHLAKCAPKVHKWEAVVGRLRDAPDPNAWKGDT